MKKLISFTAAIVAILVVMSGCSRAPEYVNNKTYNTVYVYIPSKGVPNQKFVMLLKQDVMFYFKRYKINAELVESRDDTKMDQNTVFLEVDITRMTSGKGVYIDFWANDDSGALLFRKDNVSTSAWSYTKVSNKLASSVYKHSVHWVKFQHKR